MVCSSCFMQAHRGVQVYRCTVMRELLLSVCPLQPNGKAEYARLSSLHRATLALISMDYGLP